MLQGRPSNDYSYMVITAQQENVMAISELYYLHIVEFTVRYIHLLKK